LMKPKASYFSIKKGFTKDFSFGEAFLFRNFQKNSIFVSLNI
jgi:hypothetical protein